MFGEHCAVVIHSATLTCARQHIEKYNCQRTQNCQALDRYSLTNHCKRDRNMVLNLRRHTAPANDLSLLPSNYVRWFTINIQSSSWSQCLWLPKKKNPLFAHAHIQTYIHKISLKKSRKLCKVFTPWYLRNNKYQIVYIVNQLMFYVF